MQFFFFTGCILFNSCQKKFLCPDCNVNQPPIAKAGTDQIIALPVDSVSLADKIYWAAGCTVEIKNVSAWNSSIAHPYKSMVWNSKAVIKGNDILLFGARGSMSYPASEPKFDIYNTATNTWSIGGLPRNIISAISVNNIVYVTDGVEVYKLEF